MDLSKTFVGSHSKATTVRVVKWVGRSPDRLAKLIELVRTGTPRLRDRAAWPLTCIVEENPELVKPHLKQLVAQLRRNDQPEGVKRSIVRLLQFVDVPKSLAGEVATHCFRYLADPSEAIAVRCFSITVLENLAMQNKDLQGELRIILEDQLPYASAAFVNRGKKVLRRLQ